MCERSSGHLMRGLAVHQPLGNCTSGVVRIDGHAVRCTTIATEPPRFLPNSGGHAHRVLVRIRAFSCNYRDKALMLHAVSAIQAPQSYVIGSEFVGDVVAIGAAVSTIAVGDRVVGDNHWPPTGANGHKTGGVPTNHASLEWHVLDERSVRAVPDGMPDDVAASFSLGAQTAYSMIARAQPTSGSRILVTSARSNTSLFLINALVARGASVWALTSSAAAAKSVRALGVVDALALSVEEDRARLIEAARTHGGFDVLLDPFADLHLGMLAPLAAFGARYVTCGSVGQTLPALPATAILCNLQIIGNCLGTTDDLGHALADYEESRLRVLIDSVHRDGRADTFLDRTYNDPGRFGKVVYAYA
jgi:NADPH:quinone reductase-like Zn-dependent oxidoreductase